LGRLHQQETAVDVEKSKKTNNDSDYQLLKQREIVLD
jgi:hypothetical protein